MGLDLSHYVPAGKLAITPDLEYLERGEFDHAASYLQRNSHLFVERSSPDGVTAMVLYVTETGYQRKGMNRRFYEEFENCRPYIDLATVIRAYSYLEADHINSLEDLQSNFRRTFIDNFVEGESIFHASW